MQLKREEILRREKEIAEIENRILNYSPEDLDFYIYSENNLPYLHLRKYDGYHKNNRNMNLILDLHNFFIAHKGCLVSRTIFFYILACLFKIRTSADALTELLLKANLPEDKLNAIKNIINN